MRLSYVVCVTLYVSRGLQSTELKALSLKLATLKHLRDGDKTGF